MESSLGLNDWAAGAGERRSAGFSALAFLLAATAVTPFAALALPVSLPLLASILTASLTTTVVAGLLLLFRARALRSTPTNVLAAGFFFASATMVPYLLLYPGMFAPFADFVNARPATSDLLAFSWHAGLLASMLAFGVLRRSEYGDLIMERRARGIVIVMALVYVFYTAAAISIHGLPVSYEGEHWTPFYLGVVGPVVAGLALGVIALALSRGRNASVLDLWLGIFAVAILTDVYLSMISTGHFTLGWYASRTVMLLATIALLGMLLWQAAQMFSALLVRADVLEGEAHTDIVTGLPNRRRFDEEFARAFGSAQRRAGAMAIAIVDIDHFKLYNDAFGHQAGDDALHGIAHAIADSVDRSGDFAARYGGEEFVIILEDTTLEGAVAVAERIRNTVLGAGIRAPSGGLLSVSVGVAARRAGEPADNLLRHADEALYNAKNGGRNRVSAWVRPTDIPVTDIPVNG